MKSRAPRVDTKRIQRGRGREKLLLEISVSEQLRTYPSPNPSLGLNCYQLTGVELGEGQVRSYSYTTLVTSVHHRSFCFSNVIEMGQTLPCIVVGTVIGDIKQTSGCPNKLGKYCRRIKKSLCYYNSGINNWTKPLNEIMLAIVMRADPNLILFFVSPSQPNQRIKRKHDLRHQRVNLITDFQLFFQEKVNSFSTTFIQVESLDITNQGLVYHREWQN